MIYPGSDENRLNDKEKYDIVVDMLKDRGVELEDIAAITLDLQVKYLPNLTFDLCFDHVKRVVMKREVQNAILTGLELDILAEQGKLREPLSSMLNNDYGLYGIDEVLALAIVNVYGSIGFTNFGYVDKLKPGIIQKLDDEGKKEGRCNTFLDDIVGAIAAAAASSIAHRYA
ncbi:MAG: phosphatidylglycerophosphatase A [Acholeplasmataceae bacterium]|nr:phosphatidylglycerophosphatase A [Acholeplasmataceae bacterium]